MINIEASMKTILNFKSFCERILKPTSTPTSLITVFNFHEGKKQGRRGTNMLSSKKIYQFYKFHHKQINSKWPTKKQDWRFLMFIEGKKDEIKKKEKSDIQIKK